MPLASKNVNFDQKTENFGRKNVIFGRKIFEFFLNFPNFFLNFSNFFLCIGWQIYFINICHPGGKNLWSNFAARYTKKIGKKSEIFLKLSAKNRVFPAKIHCFLIEINIFCWPKSLIFSRFSVFSGRNYLDFGQK